MKKWKTGDTLIAKSSFAKVVASDLSGEQNWVKVRYQNQDFEGYQGEFEAKGWKKFDSAVAVGCGGCLGLIGVFVILGIILSTSNPSQEQATNSQRPDPVAIFNDPQSSTAENYWATVQLNTRGIVATDLLDKTPPEEIYANHEDVCSAITSGRNLGLTLAQIKERFADSLQVNQGHDKELAANLANGLIDGALAWGC